MPGLADCNNTFILGVWIAVESAETIWVSSSAQLVLTSNHATTECWHKNAFLLQSSIWLCIANTELVVLDPSLPTPTPRFKTNSLSHPMTVCISHETDEVWEGIPIVPRRWGWWAWVWDGGLIVSYIRPKNLTMKCVDPTIVRTLVRRVRLLYTGPCDSHQT